MSRLWCPFCYAGHGHCERCGLVLVHGERRHSARTAQGSCADGDGPIRCLCGGKVVMGGVSLDGKHHFFSKQSLLERERGS